MQLVEQDSRPNETVHATEPVTRAWKKPMKVLFLGASFNADNKGLGALASGTLASVFRSFPKSEVRVLDYGKEPLAYAVRQGQRTVSVPLINLRFSKKLLLKNNIARLLAMAWVLRLVPVASLRNKVLFNNVSLKAVQEAEAAIAIAGGDSFSDIYGMMRLYYMSLPQILALLMGKPLVLLPQTYGPFKSRTARWIARFILKRAKLIYSRDQEGLKVVADLLGRNDPRARFAYDMGFALEPLPPAQEVQDRLRELKQKGSLVGFNVSGLLHMGGYKRNNMFGLKSDYPSLVRAILDFLITKQGCQVLLVPHVFGDKEDSESDIPACKRIMSELGEKYKGRLYYLEGNFDQHEIKYGIGQCDFFLGSRMHACIAALSQCVPAVGLAYSRKFAGVLDSVGGGSRVVDLREMDESQVLVAIGQALQDKSILRQELKERMPKIKESVLNLFASEEFKDLLRENRVGLPQ